MEETPIPWKPFSRRIILCTTHGGFSFSREFIDHMRKTDHPLKSTYAVARDDEFVIDQALLFGLGKAAGKRCTLEVKTIPAYCNACIKAYDGMETLECELPWEDIALAYHRGDMESEILKAIESGKIVLQ